MDAVTVLPHTVDLCWLLETNTAVPRASCRSCMRGYQTAHEKGHQRRGDTHKLLLLSAAQAEGNQILAGCSNAKGKCIAFEWWVLSVHRHPKVFLNDHPCMPLLSQKGFRSVLDCLENAGVKAGLNSAEMTSCFWGDCCSLVSHIIWFEDFFGREFGRISSLS